MMCKWFIFLFNSLVFCYIVYLFLLLVFFCFVNFLSYPGEEHLHRLSYKEHLPNTFVHSNIAMVIKMRSFIAMTFTSCTMQF